MPTFLKTRYTPHFPEKYVGQYPIVIKSSWELEFAKRTCDMNPNCLQWAYEPWEIPYQDPITGNQTIYIPDFLLTFLTPGGGHKTVLVEIKPLHQADEKYGRKGDALIQVKNAAKWRAAMAWCVRRGYQFKVLTEAQMFAGGDKITPPKRKMKPFGQQRKRR